MAGFGTGLDVELPAVQCVFLHRGDEEITIGREGDAGMRTLPFQIDRLGVHADPVQRHAVVARRRDAQAFRCKGKALDRALLGEFLGRAVGKAHERTLAVGIGNGTLRAGCDLRNPLARRGRDFADAAVGGNAQHLAVLAARDQARCRDHGSR